MLDPLNQTNLLDKAFARFLSQRATLNAPENEVFESLVTVLSQKQHQGHNCIELDDSSKAIILASGMANEVGDFKGILPLVIDQNYLYLQRYWSYENRLALRIETMLQQTGRSKFCQPDTEIQTVLDCYFAQNKHQDKWQRAAAEMAVNQCFGIITGGPGTGKTTTVVKILAVLQELSPEPLHIVLAAPTGKAAMRLQESVGKHKVDLPCSEAIKNHIPETVSTLHRLLGAKPPSPYFRHDANNPMVYDLVVVDEASMIDLALMSKLLDALKPNARLLLLGDKDQLASVESGSVLADLASVEKLRQNVTILKSSHRFEDTIKKLADAVNSQDAEQAWTLLLADGEAITLLQEDFIGYVARQQLAYLKLLDSAADFAEISKVFNRFQVLCSNRYGINSVADINVRVEQELTLQNHIQVTGLWYSGRPVMVTQNNPSLHLFNGDIGICMPDKAQGGNLMVYFQRPDGSIRNYLPSRMPACETVFAMTIHKSQGSEFDEVLIVLPDMNNPVLTKELLYTAITRARKKIRLVGSEAVFKAAVRQKVARITGLVDQFKTKSKT